MLPGKLRDLGNLGGGHVFWKNTTNAAPLGMHLQHDPRGLLECHAKEALQNIDNEIHWREVIVEQNDAP